MPAANGAPSIANAIIPPSLNSIGSPAKNFGPTEAKLPIHAIPKAKEK
jgi:hypothetical protein